jgi:3-methylcrotonyl-CoA carboxylase alpha subunit
VSAPRHIEIQVFADAHGNVIHLGERDCSLQRRHQKVIEETPAPAMTGRLRAKMGAAAVEAARAVGYASAGTVEFVADGSRGLREDGFWFIEMNTRLQVEHPVTEEVTGLDLVAWQFRVAAGEPLPMSQSEIRFNGHAVEARVYAEDPENGFLPSTGKIVGLELPRGIRVDSGVEAGGEVSPFYDAMIAKLVVHAETREAALDRMTRALDETLVAGIRNNVAFLRALCASPEFRQGHFDTGYIDRNLAALGAVPRKGIDGAAAALGIARLLTHDHQQAASGDEDEAVAASPWAATDGFQFTGSRLLTLPIAVDGEAKDATVAYGKDGMKVSVDGELPAADAKAFVSNGDVYVVRSGRQTRVRLQDFSAAAAQSTGGDGTVRAPMHGRLLSLFVRAGDAVEPGQRLAVIEAMKMEHTLRAPIAGIVTEVAVGEGAQVVEAAKILVIAPDKAG